MIKSKRTNLLIRDDRTDQMKHFCYDLTLNNSKRTKKTSNIRQRAPKVNYSGYNYFLQFVFCHMLLGNTRVFTTLNRLCLEVATFWDGKALVKAAFPSDRKFSNWTTDKKLKTEITRKKQITCGQPELKYSFIKSRCYE